MVIEDDGVRDVEETYMDTVDTMDRVDAPPDPTGGPVEPPGPRGDQGAQRMTLPIVPNMAAKERRISRWVVTAHTSLIESIKV